MNFARALGFRGLTVIAALLASGTLVASLGASPKHGKVVVVRSQNYQPAAPSKSSEAGQSQFASHNCAACHTVAGSGGCLAPPLDGIGARRTQSFIKDRITDDPAAVARFQSDYQHQELMEHPRVPAASANEIAAYLMTLPLPAGGIKITSHAVVGSRKAKAAVADKSAEAIAKGRKLFNDAGCLCCHAIGSIGGQLAPRLDGIAEKRSSQYVSEHITAAELFDKAFPSKSEANEIIMPPNDLAEKEIQQITSFIMSLPRQQVPASNDRN